MGTAPGPAATGEGGRGGGPEGGPVVVVADQRPVLQPAPVPPPDSARATRAKPRRAREPGSRHVPGVRCQRLTAMPRRRGRHLCRRRLKYRAQSRVDALSKAPFIHLSGFGSRGAVKARRVPCGVPAPATACPRNDPTRLPARETIRFRRVAYGAPSPPCARRDCPSPFALAALAPLAPLAPAVVE